MPQGQRKLIVARFDPGDADAVARIFAESDASGLPEKIGVTRRGLFRYHDLYLHLVESDGAIDEPLADAGEDPRFQEVSARLRPYMTPYDPSWRSPKDAFAEEFYVWERG